jgi:hypothetical protein
LATSLDRAGTALGVSGAAPSAFDAVAAESRRVLRCIDAVVAAIDGRLR